MNPCSKPIGLGIGALVLGLASIPARAEAPPPNRTKADALANAASKLVEHGDYDQGCAMYAESARADPSTRRFLKVAECNERRGLIASAWISASEARDIAEVRGQPGMVRAAQKRGARLENKLGKIEITVPREADVPGLEIRRDGQVVSRAVFSFAVAADPGPHVVSASAPGKHPWSAEIGLSPGKMTVKVTIPTLESERPPEGARTHTLVARKNPVLPPPEPTPGRTERTLGLVLGGAGVASLAAGTFFALRAQSTHSELANGPCAGGTCASSAAELVDTYRAQSATANVFFLIGATSVVAGTILYFTAPSSKPADEKPNLRVAPTVAPGSAGVVAVGQF